MSEIVERLWAMRGRPIKEADRLLFSNAAGEIERLRGILEEIATFTSDPVAEHAAREALSLPQAKRGLPCPQCAGAVGSGKDPL